MPQVYFYSLKTYLFLLISQNMRMILSEIKYISPVSPIFYFYTEATVSNGLKTVLRVRAHYIYVSKPHLHYIAYFADFHTDFRLGTAPHYKENAKFLLGKPLHMHYNAESCINRYRLLSCRIINEFA